MTGKDHKHIRSDPKDPNRDVIVTCNNAVCWAIGERRGRRSA